MMHLPPCDHPVRQLFDIETDLVPIGTGERSAPTLREAVCSAKRTIGVNDAVSAVYSICIAANDDIIMVRVGKRGGVKRMWNFTKGCVRHV